MRRPPEKRRRLGRSAKTPSLLESATPTTAPAFDAENNPIEASAQALAALWIGRRFHLPRVLARVLAELASIGGRCA
jgi:hypothetical protein